MFRGFRATPARGGRISYSFLWLTRQPMTAVFDEGRDVLSFPSLFPHVDRIVAAALAAAVDTRAQKGQLEHRRVDARRARIAGAVRKGAFSLTVEIRGRNHEYAVKKVLNLVNELFVALHEHHPAYLVERFGISSE